MKLIFQQIPSILVSEILSTSSVDGIVLDLEHSGVNSETLVGLIRIISLTNKMCFVRLGEIDKRLIRLALDSGATGLILSTVESEKQVNKFISLTRYPENGGCRGMGLVLDNLFGKNKLTRKKNPILVGQIETVKGLEYICETSEYLLDFCLIGPYDLSSSLGVSGNFNHPLYKDAIEKIEAHIPKEKLGIHIVRNWEEEMENYSDYSFMAVAMDTTLLLDGVLSV